MKVRDLEDAWAGRDQSGRCAATVYRRDTYRYTGGRGGFRLHYNRGRCVFKAGPGRKHCGRHAYMEVRP